MPRVKQASKRKRMSKTVPVLGAAGLSLTLASAASAATGGPVVDVLTPNTGASHQITLSDEEVSDVSLTTFYVFNKEAFRPGKRLVMGMGGCGACAGCGGCGCWTGTYYPSPVFGNDAYPPPTGPVHRYVHAPKHVPKKP